MPRRTLLTLPALGAAAVGLTVLVRGGVGPEEVPPMPEGVREPQRHDYGSDPSQFGELTLPAGVPRGVAVVVHGGFWKTAYGIEYARPLVPSLVEQGWATWAIEYRRVGGGAGGGGGNPETFDDVRAAIEELDELVLGVDPSTVPVVGIGHSAGGHLATWAAGQGLLTHVVSQAGVLDLRGAYTAGLGGPGTVTGIVGGVPTSADADIDPAQQVPLPVPVWCVHASGDDIVPISQSRSYVEAATAAGGTARLVEVEGDHFTVIDPASDAWATTLTILEAF